mmetsp:Transcript_28679/g.34992  ORF Transcript_28679/g.34992 Transcript_28679/m.34992 type:complete len:145 (-) Transcript_28679:57-491(-)
MPLCEMRHRLPSRTFASIHTTHRCVAREGRFHHPNRTPVRNDRFADTVERPNATAAAANDGGSETIAGVLSLRIVRRALLRRDDRMRRSRRWGAVAGRRSVVSLVLSAASNDLPKCGASGAARLEMPVLLPSRQPRLLRHGPFL